MQSSHDFLVAAAGAAAALAGLIIVAMTVSVDRIIQIPGMTSRAATAIGLLVAVTVISLAGLIKQPTWAFGVEALVAALAALVLAIDSVVKVVRGQRGRSLAAAIVKSSVALVPTLLLVVGSVILIQSGEAAIWIGLGTLCSIVVAVLNAWVMLVEIKR